MFRMSALRKDFMLIQRNPARRAERRNFAQQDRVGRAGVAFKLYFEWHSVFELRRIFTLIACSALSHLAGFTKRQRFGLPRRS